MDPTSSGGGDGSLHAGVCGAVKEGRGAEMHGLGADMHGPGAPFQVQLESLKKEYESQMDNLRQQLATEREKHTDQDVPTPSYRETTDRLRGALGSDQQSELDHVLQAIEDVHHHEMDNAHRQHVDDIDLHVKAMRLTLEQIYSGQMELARVEFDSQRIHSLGELQDSLDKKHKEEINRLEADWSARLKELQEEHEDDLQRSLLEEAVGSDHSRAAYIQSLNQKLSDEHSLLLEKISEDLQKGTELKRQTPKKKKKSDSVTTEAEDGDTESAQSGEEPLQGDVLGRAEDVRQMLEDQSEEIVTLRAAMLAEYEQLLTLRTETMETHRQEVEKMQQDMDDLQKTYEGKIHDFQAKVESQTGEALRLSVTEQHNKELEILQSVYEQKLRDLHESFSKERSEMQLKIDSLVSLQQEAFTGRARQEVTSSVDPESVKQDVSVDELMLQLLVKETAIEKLTVQVRELEERLTQEDFRAKCVDLEEMKQILNERDEQITRLEKEKCEIEDKCSRDMDESEKKYSLEVEEMATKMSEISAELEASREQERMLEEQYEELQHQHSQTVEGAREDLDHEKRVEVGSLQSEFKVQLEIELKRQAADFAFDHEEKLQELAKTYEDKIQQLQLDFDEKLRDVKTRVSDASPDVIDKDTGTEKSLSPDEKEVQSDVVDSRADDDTASSQASTVIELSSPRRDVPYEKLTLVCDPDTDSEMGTPRHGGMSPIGGSAMSYETEDDSLSQDISAGIDEMDTKQDDVIHDTEAVAGLLREISIQAKEDTLSVLRSEYEEKMASLDDRLREVMAQNSEYEKDMESVQDEVEDLRADKQDTEQKFQELKVNYENKLKDIEISSRTSGEKAQQAYDENVTEIRQEFEEKMDLLRQELQESFEMEKDDLIRELQTKVDEVEEKYESLIESVRSGNAPEVADIVRDKIDTELEMAKMLMQQEFDETLESEQTRLIEQQQQEMDDIQAEHDRDMADSRQTLQDDYEARIHDLEQLHLAEMSRLQHDLEVLSVESTPRDIKQDPVQEVEGSVEEKHAQQITEMRAEHEMELTSLQSQYDAKLNDLEDKYTTQINHLISRLDGHLTVNEGTLELAGVVSPVHAVPRLENLEQELDMEEGVSSGENSVPTRSTPRDLDSERSLDRSEVMERLAPPSQLSPTSLSDRDHDSLKSEELLMRFDSDTEDNGMEERPGARLGHIPLDTADFSSEEETISSPARVSATEELIICEQTPTQSASLGRTSPLSKEGLLEEKERDETEADRTLSPDLLLQTLPLTLMTLQLSEMETGLQSTDVQQALFEEVKEKNEKIKWLETEIERLNRQLVTQMDEERVILISRERESREDQNLTELLRQDMARVNEERDLVQQTNEHLLQLLSDTVKTFMSVEEVISKKLTKIVVDGASQPDQTGARSAEHSPGSADGREFHDSGDVPQETSILSTDEGLDLSQRLCESMFLDSEGEELLADASQRLQGSVTRLLDLIEDTTLRLTEARHTQHDLVSTLSSGQQESHSLESRCREMEARLHEEVEAKQYLTLELHKAEGLIEGYSTECETLKQKIEELEDKKQALVLNLETTRNKLSDLETIHHEARSLREEIQRQHQLVEENAGGEAQVSVMTTDGTPPSGQALMLEVHRLHEEKRDLAQQLRTLQERYEIRVRDLEHAGEETEHHYVTLLNEKKAEMVDLRLQLDVAEKQVKAHRQFMDEEAVERERERDDYQTEIEVWKQRTLESEKEKKAETRLQREVDDLTEQLESRLDRDSKIVEQTAQLQRDLRDKQMTAEEMRALVMEQEKELEERGRVEDSLRQKLRELEGKVTEQHQVNMELSQIIRLPPNVESDEDEVEVTTRHRRLLPSHMSLQQEEDLLHEKEALQHRMEQQLNKISALENQVDALRHRGGLGDDSHISTLQRRLDRQSEVVETRDRELEELKAELKTLTGQLGNKERLVQQLTEHIESTARPDTLTDRDAQLEGENKDMKTQIKSLQSQIDSLPMSELNQSLINEKNQEIDHLNRQIEMLNYEVERLRSSEEITRLQEEVDRQQMELEQSKTDIQFLRASQSSAFSGDGSDIEAPGVTDSFSEKTNLQQEMEESFALKYRNEVETLRMELQRSKDLLARKLETRPNTDQVDPTDPAQTYDVIQEKEALIEQMTIQIESLSSEVESLNDFQTKLSEDFDLVQNMLEEKEREIDTLTRELTEKSAESPTAIASLEMEMAQLHKDLQEKDNVIDEKAEEMYLLNEKLEQQETKLTELKADLDKAPTPETIQALLDEKDAIIKIHDEHIEEKTAAIKSRDEKIVKMEEQLDDVQEHLKIAENLQRKLEEAGLLGPDILAKEKDQQIADLQREVDTLRERPQHLAGEQETRQAEDDKVRELTEELEAVTERSDGQIAHDLKEITDLRTELEATRERSDGQIAHDLKEVTELRNELEAAKEAIETLRERSDGQIAHDVKEITELRNELEAAKEAIETLRERSDGQIAHDVKEITELRNELEAAKEAIETLRERSDSQIAHDVKEITELRNELEAAKEAIEAQRAHDLEESTELRNELQASRERSEAPTPQDTDELVEVELWKDLGSPPSDVEITEERPEISDLEDKSSDGTNMEDLKRELICLREEISTKNKEIQRFKEVDVVDTESELESLREEMIHLRKDAEQARSIEARVDVQPSDEASEQVIVPENAGGALQGKDGGLEPWSEAYGEGQRGIEELEKVRHLEEELEMYRGLESSQVVEDLREKDEEISILRGALQAMKSGEEDLTSLLREKDDSLIKMSGELEVMKVDGESDGDQLLRDKVAEVIRLQQELASVRQDLERKSRQELQSMEENLAISQEEGRQLRDEIDWLQQQVDSLREMKVQEGDSQFDLEQKLSDAVGRIQQKDDQLTQTTAQLTEREDQLHQLQTELQLLQQEGDANDNHMESVTAELQTVRHHLADVKSGKEAELEDMKQKLLEAVEFSEAQLHLVDQKDDEYATLRLESQQATIDNNQSIKDLKQQLQTTEADREEDIRYLENQLQQLQAASERGVGGGDAIATVTNLQAEIQDKDEAVKVLETELEKSSLAVEEKAQELEKILEELQKARTSQVQNEEELMVKAQELDLVYTELHDSKKSLQQTVEELERKAQELERKASEVTKLHEDLQQAPETGHVDLEVRIDQETVVIPEATQKHIKNLELELDVAKAALLELQQQVAAQGVEEPSPQRVTPVLRLRSSSEEEEEDYSLLDHDTLVQKMTALKQELRLSSSELELFRSTSSLSAKDYVRKVMELRDELSQQHQRHIHDIQSRARHEADTTLMQLRIRYDDEIEHLRGMHAKVLDNKVGEVRRDLGKQHKMEINRLIAKHKQEMELTQVREPKLAQDTSAMEHLKRLQTEIAVSEQIDNRLQQTMTDGAQDQVDNGDTASTAASTTTDLSFNENVPARLQNLMERLHKESVQVLTMSELHFLNRHLNAEKVDREADLNALRSSWDNEKQSLISALQSLKDLLAQTHKLRGLDKGAEISDWRGELLQCVGFVFAKEREMLLAELRTHVMSHPNTQLTEIQKLDKKIRNSEGHQRASLDQIFHADRQSLLAEIRDLRAHVNISQIRSQEDRERLTDQLNDMEDQGVKRERQLRRQVKLLEYKQQQEKILADDLRASLDTERERSTELSTALSREKMGNLDYQTDMSSLNVQVASLKESLEHEQSRFISVTHMWDALVEALEEEKGKCHTLAEKLEAEKYRVRDLKNDLDEANIRSEVRDKISSTIEKLQSELVTERDFRLKAENSHELDRVKINALHHDLNTERKNLQMLESEYETKVTELKTALELEKIRAVDLLRALEKEQEACHKLRQNLYDERNSVQQSDEQMLEDLQVALETEKAVAMDLRGALEHEKQRVASIVATVATERTAMKDNVDQEKAITRKVKHDLDTMQLQNLEFTRMFERERDQVARLKAEREQLRTEIKSMKDQDNERERQRDTEKLSERRRLRHVERERDDHKIKLHEQTLEAQRLKQKVADLQDQLSESREKELCAVRDLEHERLASIHTQMYDGLMNGGTRDTGKVSEDRWNVYKAQLQSLSQSLQFLILQYRDGLDRALKSEESGEMQRALSELLSELKQLQMPLEFESQSESNLLARPNPNKINERVLRHNADLTSFVARLTEEKMELRNTLGQLEDQLWHNQQRGTTLQNGAPSDPSSRHLEDRANWAKERLSLQLALNDAQQRIDHLTIERDQRSIVSSNGIEADHEKVQRLYGKYLRAESFRKALVYQKKYLLLLLGGFQDCEETTLAMLAQMGAYPSLEDVNRHQHRRRPYNIFRSAAKVIIAISRMKYLVKKWRRATRVGSPVVGGSVNMQQGYMPSAGSFSPPRINGSPLYSSGVVATRPSRVTFSASSPPGDSDSNSPSSYRPIGLLGPRGLGSTPPTKDHSLVRQPVPRDTHTGARRKLLSTSHKTIPSSHGHQGATSHRSEEPKESQHDDYIKRLENLQKTLSSISSSGTPRRGGSPYH